MAWCIVLLTLVTHARVVCKWLTALLHRSATDAPISLTPDSTLSSDTGRDDNAVPVTDATASDAQPFLDSVVVSDSSPTVSPQAQKVDMSYDRVKRLETKARKEIAELAGQKRKICFARTKKRNVKAKSSGAPTIDLDTQEPGSQSESAVHIDQVTQELSTQRVDDDKELFLPKTDQDNSTSVISASAVADQYHGQDTQEPSVHFSEAVQVVQAPQEPFIQSMEACQFTDSQALMVPPLSSRPLDTEDSGTDTNPDSAMVVYSPGVRMTTDRPLHEGSPVSMTALHSSLPSLISSFLSALSLFRENERKDLEKNRILEGQSPELAKGEVEMSDNAMHLCQENLTLKSSDTVMVSSDEITEKEKRDLGVTDFVAGTSNTPAASQDQSHGSHSNSDKSGPDDSSTDILASHRQAQWDHSWTDPSSFVGISGAHVHLATAFKEIQSSDLKAHLKGTSLMLKAIFEEIQDARTTTAKSIADVVAANTQSIARTSRDFSCVHRDHVSLEHRIATLEKKAESMDAKLDLLLSALVPDAGTDAKKGEKVVSTKCSPELGILRKDDAPDGGSRQKQVSSDAATRTRNTVSNPSLSLQSTQVSGSSSQKQYDDIIVTTAEQAKKFHQTVNIDGTEYTVHYKDPRLEVFNEQQARKILQEMYPDEDVEEMVEAQRIEYEMLNSQKGTVRSERKGNRTRGRGHGRGRGSTIKSPSKSQKGIVIKEGSNTGADMSSGFSAVSAKGKGKKVLEGPPQVMITEQDVETSHQEEEEGDDLPLTQRRRRREDSRNDRQIFLVRTSLNVEAAKQAEKDYFKSLQQRSFTKSGMVLEEYLRKKDNVVRSSRSAYGFKKVRGYKGKGYDIREDKSHFQLNEIFKSSGHIKSLPGITCTDESGKFKKTYEEVAKKKNECRRTGTYGGIGHPAAEIVPQVASFDQACLTENLSDKITQRHLDKLISVQMVYDIHDGNMPKEKLVYFLKDGSTFVLTELDVSMKNLEELRYVQYMLVPKDDLCIKWRRKIQSSINLHLMGLNQKNTGYAPKYIDMDGQEVEMKKGSAFVEKTLGEEYLSFCLDSERIKLIYLDDRMLRSSIEDLRAAVYQTNKDDENLR
ncbi:hypothetical protein POM88_021895 [Heracleum sosnowskyi]|uniref:Uncharacterized protein n=1 Tax=Heracleum sosnowskyi TaxID=360622 RepID=A0AAD8IHS5_9APIA|nr:hypothetical protein POM88_021895 [Heracleum sosnowskyi]